MAITPKRLIAGSQLSTSWALYYTVPSSVISATAKQIVVCNTDTVPRTFYYAVTATSSAPGTDHDGTIMFHAVTMQANETKVIGLTDVMPTAYCIYAKAGEAGGGSYVTFTVSGMENQ